MSVEQEIIQMAGVTMFRYDPNNADDVQTVNNFQMDKSAIVASKLQASNGTAVALVIVDADPDLARFDVDYPNPEKADNQVKCWSCDEWVAKSDFDEEEDQCKTCVKFHAEQ
jgi:formylmethanofuran dehydrogenase subunit E